MPSFHRKLAWVSVLATAALAQPSTSALKWTSPVDGDNYVAGDTTTIKWETKEALTKPVILLCFAPQAGRVERDCAPQNYPNDGPDPGSHSLDVTFPIVLGQDNFVFIIGDSNGDRFFSPTFSIRPPPKATPSAKVNAIAGSKEEDENVQKEVFADHKFSKSDDLKAILGPIAAVLGVAVIFIMIVLWRRRNRKLRQARERADYEARRASNASFLYRTFSFEDDGADVGNPPVKKGVHYAEDTITPSSSYSPFQMIRDFSAGKETSRVRYWLPPIPRVWRFFVEEKEEKEGKRQPQPQAQAQAQAQPQPEPPKMEQRPTQSSTGLSYASSIHQTNPSAKRRGTVRFSDPLDSPKLDGTMSSPYTPRSESHPRPPTPYHEKEEDEVFPPTSPSLSNFELLKTPPRVYDPESIGTAFHRLRMREQEV